MATVPAIPPANNKITVFMVKKSNEVMRFEMG
jgi:Rps23 Pro-64 3,4-dihydroxylase Tpa1-like proline 4-hydroxylase